MSDVQYVSQLELSQIRQAQADSQSFWGGTMSLDDRMARLERHLNESGPTRLRICGLIDASGDVVSSAKLYQLQLLLEGTIYPAVGIGAVFTPERCRGQGNATRLLQMVADDVAQSGGKAILLFSDIAPAFYERLGYTAFPAFNWSIDVKSLPAANPFSIRQASSAGVDMLCQLYESSLSHEISRPHRDSFRWTFFRDLNRAGPDLLLLDGTQVVGYLTASPSESCYWVDEYVVEADQSRLWATVRSLAEESGASEVRGWQGLKSLPRDCRLKQRDRAIPMLKFLDPTLTNLKLDPQLTHFGSVDHF